MSHLLFKIYLFGSSARKCKCLFHFSVIISPPQQLNAPLSLWFIQMMWSVNLLKICRGPWVVSPTALRSQRISTLWTDVGGGKAEPVGSLPAMLLNRVTQGALCTLTEEATCSSSLNGTILAGRKIVAERLCPQLWFLRETRHYPDTYWSKTFWSQPQSDLTRLATALAHWPF